MINNNYNKALKEVYIILKFLGKDITDKIPTNIMNFIEENMDKSYIFLIDEKVPIEQQNFSNKTLGIISLIYIDYIASEKEREKIRREDAFKLKKLQKELSEKYNYEDLFKNKRKKEKVNDNELGDNKELILYEEKWYSRVLNYLFKLFKRQR